MKWLSALLLTVVATVVTTAAGAQESTKPYEEFGDYKVYFSVFNSSFITPEIAQANNLTRAKDRVYINISVVKNNSLGLPATVSGTAKNLMQQSKELEFTKISESNATYYLAPLFHHNEEVIHFSIDIKPVGETRTHTVTFSKKLYQN